ncbi:MAG TPA: ACT domain-containing protein [Acidimicrobiales bacterium]|jgi:glycine cleavage system transcriptional repressor|nr:ACT domain-containing protein [Acidimicrobiales bacterium]
MAHFALTAVGKDRPGIVAAVTGVLVEHQCNLEDTSMSILRGHFAMMLVVAGPDVLNPAALEDAVVQSTGAYDLVVAVRRIDDDVPDSPEGDAWTVAVYGADRPGIVHQVTALLADAGVNVTDLTTRVIGDAARPVYAMVLEVTLPPGVAPDEVAARLDAEAASLGVECSLHPSEADIL